MILEHNLSSILVLCICFDREINWSKNKRMLLIYFIAHYHSRRLICQLRLLITLMIPVLPLRKQISHSYSFHFFMLCVHLAIQRTRKKQDIMYNNDSSNHIHHVIKLPICVQAFSIIFLRFSILISRRIFALILILQLKLMRRQTYIKIRAQMLSNKNSMMRNPVRQFPK